jgi:L-lactate dehydrogenase complex protein LldF
MRIPLPRMLRQLRERQYAQYQAPKAIRFGLSGWAFLARRPSIYRMATAIGVAILGRIGRRKGRFRRLPMAGGWTTARDLPAPQGHTFQRMWASRGGRRR